jgi:CheY-like chemotaxis protein
MAHILIVDDEVAITYVFERFFMSQGYRVTVANDGHSALQLTESDPVNGMVTDFRMPGMNGLELVRRIRERQPGLPAIIVSAYPSEITLVDSNTKVMSKPVSSSILLQSMKSMLGDGKATSQPSF